MTGFQSGANPPARGRSADPRIADTGEVRENRREFEREKHRIGCQFTVDGRTQSGIVGDISARSLFVNTSAKPTEGAEVELVMREPKIGDIAVRGHVARRPKTHRAVRIVAPAGFAMTVEDAPEPFFELLVMLGLS